MSSSIRIDILNDLAGGPPGPTDIEQWLRLVIDDYVAVGRIRTDIELINAWGLGLPSGTAARLGGVGKCAQRIYVSSAGRLA